MDDRIPGPSLQYAFWNKRELADFPFDFEHVTRPLRYVVYSLHDIGRPQMSTCKIVFFIGAHLEGCVKDLCGETKYQQPVSFRTAWGHMPLGTLVKIPWFGKSLRRSLCHAITKFHRLDWHPANHDFTNNGSPDPLTIFPDAVCSCFLARGSRGSSTTGHGTTGSLDASGRGGVARLPGIPWWNRLNG